MSLVSRKVDSSWLNTPFKTPILDCIFSQLSNGRATKSFSVWDWLNSNREFSKKILDLGDRGTDYTRVETPIDFCHSNSIQFSKALNSYIVSLRNLDLIMLIDATLKQSTQQMYSPGARQHFARILNSTQITALGNYTNGGNSKLETWTKSGTTWNLTEIILPVKIAYCGNVQVIPGNRIWVAGGCGNFEKDTAGILYSSLNIPVKELARFKLMGSSGSYRVDLYNP